MNEIKDLSAKLNRFAALLNLQQLGALKADGTDCEANRLNRATSVKIGPKYSRVDIGNSGRYMVVNATGEIFGIKAYGVIHKGHPFGTLDTIQDWDWSGYRATPKGPKISPGFIARKLCAASGETVAIPAPAPAPKPSEPAALKPSEPAALKLGDRVSATLYGVLKQGTVDHIAQGGIVFVRWDGAKAPNWQHPQSLTKIESAACRPVAPSGAFLVEGKCFSTQKEAIDYAESRYAKDGVILGIERATPASILSYLQGIIAEEPANVVDSIARQAFRAFTALEKIRVAASANSYTIQYEADNLDGLIKAIFNIADEALRNATP